jgi:hypothetical protein
MAVVINDKVGRSCINRLQDVAAIQDALNRVPVQQGGTPPNKKLPVNGTCGPQTVEAIQLFQLKQFGWPGADGKVFPNGETHTRLNQILGNGNQTPGVLTPVLVPETERTTQAFLIRMSTGGVDKTLIYEIDTLFLSIEDAANNLTAIYRVLHFFSRKEPTPPFHKFGLPEAMAWTEPIAAGAFENAGFHYISRTVSTTSVRFQLPEVASQNTMVLHLHPDRGNPSKEWFFMRRNTIAGAWESAWEAAQQGKYGVWFERRIEGRLERVA